MVICEIHRRGGRRIRGGGRQVGSWADSPDHRADQGSAPKLTALEFGSPEPAGLCRAAGSLLRPVALRWFRPRGLFVADGGSACREGSCCASGSGVPCCEVWCPSPCRSRPWLSLGFPRVLFPSGVCWGGLEWNTGRRSAAFPRQRTVPLVGVTGFEPAASASRTGDHSSLPCC